MTRSIGNHFKESLLLDIKYELHSYRHNSFEKEYITELYKIILHYMSMSEIEDIIPKTKHLWFNKLNLVLRNPGLRITKNLNNLRKTSSWKNYVSITILPVEPFKFVKRGMAINIQFNEFVNLVCIAINHLRKNSVILFDDTIDRYTFDYVTNNDQFKEIGKQRNLVIFPPSMFSEGLNYYRNFS